MLHSVCPLAQAVLDIKQARTTTQKAPPLTPVLIFIVNLLLIAEIPQRYPDIDTNTIY
jgi:hypothetical protein